MFLSSGWSSNENVAKILLASLGSAKKPQFLLHFLIDAHAFVPYHQWNCIQRTVPSPDFAKEGLIST